MTGRRIGGPRAAGVGLGWCLVVPVKRLDVAKSRLADVAGPLRSELALAFAADTVSAALRTAGVSVVIAVTDDHAAADLLRRLGAVVVTDEPNAGLNPALRHGARRAAEQLPGAAIGALSSDLPALRSDELARALALARGPGVAVVADADGSGTTAYLAPPGVDFAPEFGPASLRIHAAAGASPLMSAGLDSLRRDVDTARDLAAAALLGVGAHTAAVLARMPAPDTRHQ